MVISGENIVFRIDEILEGKDLTRADACRSAKINLRAMTDWAKKGTIPAADTLYLIASYLGTTVEYLVTGKFPEGIEPKIKDMSQKIASLSSQDREEIMFFVDHKLRREKNTKKDKKREYEIDTFYDSETTERPPSYSIVAESQPPYIAATPETEGFDNVVSIDYDMVGILYLGDYAATAAGELREMLDVPEDHQIWYLPRKLLKANSEECFCLPVHGTSMTQADISDGDVVVLKTAERPENGAIMLVSYEGKSTLKKVVVRKEKVFLQWEDGSGRIEEINKEGYQILGKLILILKLSQEKSLIF